MFLWGLKGEGWGGWSWIDTPGGHTETSGLPVEDDRHVETERETERQRDMQTERKRKRAKRKSEKRKRQKDRIAPREPPVHPSRCSERTTMAEQNER